MLSVALVTEEGRREIEITPPSLKGYIIWWGKIKNTDRTEIKSYTYNQDYIKTSFRLLIHLKN